MLIIGIAGGMESGNTTVIRKIIEPTKPYANLIVP